MVKLFRKVYKFNNYIFDWSGTLVDDLGPVLDATNRVFNHYGKDSFTREEFCSEFCLPFKIFYDKFLPEAPMSELELLYTKFFNQSHENVFLLPGAKEILRECSKLGIKTYLLSSIKKQHFESQSAELGLSDFFDFAYTEALDKRDWITRLLKDNNISHEHTVFIGDMQHDIETARYAEVFSVGVLTGYNSKEMIEGSNPDLIVNDLVELLEIIINKS